MAAASYLSISKITTGTTTSFDIPRPIGVEIGDIVIYFISAFNIGLSPSSPDLTFITEVTGTTGSLFAFYYKVTNLLQTSNIIIDGLSSIFNTGYSIHLRGCSTDLTKLINQSNGFFNLSGSSFKNVFVPTVNRTIIIQGVSMFDSPISSDYVEIQSWSVTTTPTTTLNWIDSLSSSDGLKTVTTYSIYNGCGVNVNSPKIQYDDFQYNLNTPHDNHQIILFISSKNIPNRVMN